MDKQDTFYHATRMPDEKPCSVCGRMTNLAEVYVLAGLRIPLCSQKCYDAYWEVANVACNGQDGEQQDGCGE